MALKDDVLRKVEEAEERLFNDLDGVAYRAGVPCKDVLTVFEEAGEMDLADKYHEWLIAGDDE